MTDPIGPLNRKPYALAGEEQQRSMVIVSRGRHNNNTRLAKSTYISVSQYMLLGSYTSTGTVSGQAPSSCPANSNSKGGVVGYT
jgi:hypothetical protein